MMVMTTRKPEISVQARCSVDVIMCSLGFSLSRCHSLTVAIRTKKAIRYPSTASALAVSWKLAYLETERESLEPDEKDLSAQCSVSAQQHTNVIHVIFPKNKQESSDFKSQFSKR